jgi:hypothetical protein
MIIYFQNSILQDIKSVLEIFYWIVAIFCILFTIYLKMRPAKFTLERFIEHVDRPVESNWSIRILHPNKRIAKCIVLYDGSRLPWGDSELCYEKSIGVGGGGNVRIPAGKERENAEVKIMDGKKTLKRVKFRDITKANP